MMLERLMLVADLGISHAVIKLGTERSSLTFVRFVKMSKESFDA